MSKYFHSNEMDEVVSLDRIRSEFEQFQSEGEYLDEPFDYYLEGCMYWNNGDLTPLTEYSDHLKRRLHQVLTFIRDECEREYYEDEIDTLTAQIKELEQYKED